MKICFVALNAYPLLANDGRHDLVGGAELQQTILARELSRRGHDVTMICWNFGQPADCRIDGINVLRACGPDAGLPVIRFVSPRLTSIWRELRRADADVYYQRCSGMLTGIVAHFCLRNGRRSVFAAASNADFDPQTPLIPYARDRWLYRYGLRHVDHILAQNPEQVEMCLRYFDRRAILLPNCYALPAGHAGRGGNRVLWVSTIRGLKRPEILLDIAQSMPEVKFRMIGGPDPRETQLYRHIEARAKMLPNVEFLGFVPFREVEQHFDDATLLVNTSDFEGFPNTFLQAWARRVPTISFCDSGARLDGRPVGQIVSNPAQMLSEIDRHLREKGYRDLQADRCWRYYTAHHLPDIAVTRIETLLCPEGTP